MPPSIVVFWDNLCRESYFCIGSYLNMASVAAYHVEMLLLQVVDTYLGQK